LYEYNGKLINRRVRAFFIPGFIVTLAVTFSMFLDIFLVGRMVGPTEMAAVQMALPITMIFNMVYMLFGTGGEVLVAAAKGAQNGKEADKLFTVTMIFVVVFSIVLALVGAYFAPQIAASLAKKSPAIAPLLERYVRLIFIGAPFLICIMSCSSFVKADALPNLSALVALTANIVSVASKIIYLGPMKLGIDGAALGTITGYAASFIPLACLWLFNRRKRVLNFASVTAKDFSRLGNIFLTGLPSSLGQGIGAIVSMASNVLILSVAGKDGLVAFTAANSVVIFLSSFRYASPMTIAPLVGAMYGERDWWSMLQTAKRVMLICVVGSAICALPVELFPAKIIMGFGAKDPAVVSMGARLLRVLAANVIFSVILHVIMTYYQATARKVLSIFISASIDSMDLIMKYIFTAFMGVAGLYVSTPAASLAVLVLVFCCARYVECRTKNAPISYHGVFFIHERSLEYAENNTIKPTVEDAEGIASVVRDFAVKNGIPGAAEKSAQLVKKAALEIIAKNGAKGRSIDIMQVVWKGCMQMRLRDDGPAFTQTKDEDGIVHAAVMGYNNTFIKVPE
jgi:Na+-driven multidrug efflux pump